MSVKLLIKDNLEFLSLKKGCRGPPHCWKSHVAAHFDYSANVKNEAADAMMTLYDFDASNTILRDTLTGLNGCK